MCELGDRSLQACWCVVLKYVKPAITFNAFVLEEILNPRKKLLEQRAVLVLRICFE